MNYLRKSLRSLLSVLVIIFCFSLSFADLSFASLQIGVAKKNITAQVYGRQRMGYVKETQVSTGIHTPLFARAFVVQSTSTRKKIVYVIADLTMIFKSVQQAVVNNLQKEFGSEFGDENIMITATHTHAAPAGLSHHHMFNLFYGFNPKDFSIVVDGITAAIREANQNLKSGKIFYN